MIIYLTRHGKTNQNKDHLVSGNSNHAQLIEEGKNQAEKIGKFLRDKKVDIILSSPLDRALNTAKIINKHISTKLDTSDLLREFDFGDLDGKSEEHEVKDLLEKRRLDLSTKAPNGGSYLDLLNNASEFIKKIEKLKQETILVISHAGIMRSLLASLTKEKIKEDPTRLDTIDCPNGAIYTFNTKNNNLEWFNVNSNESGKGLIHRTGY